MTSPLNPAWLEFYRLLLDLSRRRDELRAAAAANPDQSKETP